MPEGVAEKIIWTTTDGQQWPSKQDAEQVQKQLNFTRKLKEFQKLHRPLSFGINDTDFNLFYRFRYEIRDFFSKYED